MWVCGLKQATYVDKKGGDWVAPYVGVWIETLTRNS